MTMTVPRIMRPFCSLLLLASCQLAIPTVALAAVEEGTCVLGQDGTCIDEGQPNDTAASTATADACEDEHDNCNFWATSGECEANPKYMLHSCRVSCETCSMTPGEIKKAIQAKAEELEGEIDIEETEFGVAQEAEGKEAAQTQAIIHEMEDYMRNTVYVDPAYESVRNQCKNRNSQCAFWALSGECEANPAFMILQCAPLCKTCDKISFDARCPWDPETTPDALRPGDLNLLFERLTTDPYYSQYQPTIHSRPVPLVNAENGAKDAPAPQEGPWVVTLDSFVTEEECERLITQGANEGYEISKDVGEKNFDGTFSSFQNSGRTSTNAWCNDNCSNDPGVANVLDKIANVTGIAEANNEFLQLLRYDIGQFYQRHHDYIDYQIDRPEGVRILTVYLYLTDVDEGGGTNFPELDITVMPKRGKALIWPSVLDDLPNSKDDRTDHQALPVKKGLKYGANAWVHQRDFKEPYARSCI